MALKSLDALQRKPTLLDRRLMFADGWKPHITWLVILKNQWVTQFRTYNSHPKSFQNYQEALREAERALATGKWDIVIIQEKS